MTKAMSAEARQTRRNIMSKRVLKGQRSFESYGPQGLTLWTDRPHTASRNNDGRALAPFLAEAMTGGGLPMVRTDTRATWVARNRAAEAEAAAAAPEAAEALRMAGPIVRAMALDSAAGRVADGCDGFQTAALAVLTAEPGDDVRALALAAVKRPLRQSAVRVATTVSIDEAEAVAAPEAEAEADPRVSAALAVWRDLGKRDRETVRRALAGRPETVGSILGVLAALGWLAD